MRDEVLIHVEDTAGFPCEAYQVGQTFAVREVTIHEKFTPKDPDPSVHFTPTHVIIHLPSESIVPVPNEELAWFFADQLAINADELNPEELDEFMIDSAAWAREVLTTGEKIPYHHYKRQQEQKGDEHEDEVPHES